MLWHNCFPKYWEIPELQSQLDNHWILHPLWDHFGLLWPCDSCYLPLQQNDKRNEASNPKAVVFLNSSLLALLYTLPYIQEPQPVLQSSEKKEYMSHMEFWSLHCSSGESWSCELKQRSQPTGLPACLWGHGCSVKSAGTARSADVQLLLRAEIHFCGLTTNWTRSWLSSVTADMFLD